MFRFSLWLPAGPKPCDGKGLCLLCSVRRLVMEKVCAFCPVLDALWVRSWWCPLSGQAGSDLLQLVFIECRLGPHLYIRCTARTKSGDNTDSTLCLSGHFQVPLLQIKSIFIHQVVNKQCQWSFRSSFQASLSLRLQTGGTVSLAGSLVMASYSPESSLH